MTRYLTAPIFEDLRKKMVVVTGPRQVGKTTMARALDTRFMRPIYLNFDSITDRERILQADWARSHDYVVLDEIHSMPQWKAYLKGVVDTKPASQALLVTGSARLDTFRQAGESLAGRYHRWRLHPFSVRELCAQTHTGADDALDALLRFGGFPEALFEATDAARKRWQNQYFTDLVREDVMEFSRIHEVRAMRSLVEMLRRRTGSPLSFDSLARDLSIAPNTVRSYIDVLEALHIVFLVRPYHRNIARAQSKAPKLYFYDWAYVQNANLQDEQAGAQFENLMATHLLKHTCFLADSAGDELSLKPSRLLRSGKWPKPIPVHWRSSWFGKPGTHSTVMVLPFVQRRSGWPIWLPENWRGPATRSTTPRRRQAGIQTGIALAQTPEQQRATIFFGYARPGTATSRCRQAGFLAPRTGCHAGTRRPSGVTTQPLSGCDDLQPGKVASVAGRIARQQLEIAHDRMGADVKVGHGGSLGTLAQPVHLERLAREKSGVPGQHRSSWSSDQSAHCGSSASTSIRMRLSTSVPATDGKSR